MSIISETRGDFELKSVIEEMYHCREDEILNLPRESKRSIDIRELSKLPNDVIAQAINKSKDKNTNLEYTKDSDDDP